MKLAIALFFSGLSFSALAAPKQLDIDNTSYFDLSTETESSLLLVVQYPGKISGVCGLEIRADSYNRAIPISGLQSELQLRETFGAKPPILKVQNETTLRMDLQDGGFQTSIEMKTKSGKALRDVIQESIGAEGITRHVVLVPTSCP
jgi:hypothetical protein